VGPNAINQAVYAKLPYDAEKSFAPITLTSIVPQLLVTSPASGIPDLKTLVARAKASPGTLKFASGGTASSNHLAGELLQSMTGIKMIHVPYKGDAAAMVDLMAGQVTVVMPTAIAAIAHVKAGRLKALGVSPKKRIAALPEVPTIDEAGAPGFESVSWGGVMAPAGTPARLVNALHREIVRIIRLPDVSEKLQALGADVVGSTPQEFAAYVRAEIKKWSDVAKRANVRLD
jgi:tripartite-type tricarboxylate transporter receptor subunit TctC